MAIAYLSGKAIIDLKNAGAVSCLYDTSTTYEYLGDVTSVYFFDASGQEIAHQTGLSGQVGYPEFAWYRRTWGNSNKAAYKKSGLFGRLLQNEVYENSIYNIIGA